MIGPDSHVVSPLFGWQETEGIVLISNAMAGDQRGPRFAQYLVHGSENAVTTQAAEGVQRVVYVLEGNIAFDGETLEPDSYLYLPAEDQYELKALDGSLLLVFEKRYEVLQGVAPPKRIVGHLRDMKPEPFMGDDQAMLGALLPTELPFDMAVNVFTFQPGTALPLVETHIMEHGLYMKEGQGIYRLADSWYPVQKGDTIWMGSYCPQWFVAMGRTQATYIYYKDIHRDPLLGS